ncbi:hypothetical protein JHK84_027737 [Glycine max]|nr:hypothetical protein JHK84_027737 [Glycine max]
MPSGTILLDDIQQKRQKKLAKTIANEDKALETFGLATKVKRILREQKGKVQTKKPAQQQKDLLAIGLLPSSSSFGSLPSSSSLAFCERFFRH